MPRERRSPVRHTVHTRDPRYKIPKYNRGIYAIPRRSERERLSEIGRPPSSVIIWANESDQWKKEYFREELIGDFIVVTSTSYWKGNYREKRTKPLYEVKQIISITLPSHGYSGVVGTSPTLSAYRNIDKAIADAERKNKNPDRKTNLVKYIKY